MTYKQRHADDWPHPLGQPRPAAASLSHIFLCEGSSQHRLWRPRLSFPVSHANLTILSLTYSSRHQIFIGAVPTCRVRMARLRLEQSLSLLCLMPFAHAKWPRQAFWASCFGPLSLPWTPGLWPPSAPGLRPPRHQPLGHLHVAKPARPTAPNPLSSFFACVCAASFSQADSLL